MRFPEKFWFGLLVTLGLTLLAVAFFGEQGLREVTRLRAERQQLASEIARLQAQRDALEKEILSLKEDPRTIEARARRDLGMIREGETIFLLPERHDTDR